MSFSVKKTGGRMWHEARKQEKKIRGMLVDYRRRAERRRDYYEKIKSDPTQFLQLHGRPCKIHLDPAIATAGDSPANMMPWQGNEDNLIDRFDVRAHLDWIPEAPDSIDVDIALTSEDRHINYERYRIIVQNEFLGVTEEKFLHQIHLEEQFGSSTKLDSARDKKKSCNNVAIGYNYETEEPIPETVKSLDTVVSDEKADDEDSDIDLDICVDVSQIEPSQAHEMNLVAQKYGLLGADYFSFLTQDFEEAETLRQARKQEEEKAMYSGRRSRRERRAFREKKMIGRVMSPPSYAARESPEYNPYRKSSSKSRSRSVSPVNAGQITYITSFGGEEETHGSSSHITSSHSRKINYSHLRRRRSDSPTLNERTINRKHSKSRSRSCSRSVNKSKSYRNRDRKRSTSKIRSRRTHSRHRKITRSRTRSRSRRSRTRSESRSRYRSFTRSRSRTTSRSKTRSRSRSRPKRSRSSSSSSISRSKSRSRSRSKSHNRSHSRDSYRRRHYSPSKSVSKSRSRSKSQSRSRSRSRSQSRCKRSRSIENKAPTLPRYYGRRGKSSSLELELSDSEEKASTATPKPTVTNTTSMNKPKAGLSTNSGGGHKSLKITPQERLKKKMQALLNRQYKADKKAEQLRIEKMEQQRQDREDEIREMSLKLRRKQRERRHRYEGHSSDSHSSVSRTPSPGRSPRIIRRERKDRDMRDFENDRERERDRERDRRDDREKFRTESRRRYRDSPLRSLSPRNSRNMCDSTKKMKDSSVKNNVKNEQTDQLCRKESADKRESMLKSTNEDVQRAIEGLKEIPDEELQEFLDDEDFMQGLDVVDAWEGDKEKGREVELKTAHIKDQEQKRPSRERHRRDYKGSNRERPKREEKKHEEIRRDPSKSTKDIERDKIRTKRDNESKLLAEKEKAIKHLLDSDNVVPPGTETEAIQSITERQNMEQAQMHGHRSRERRRSVERQRGSSLRRRTPDRIRVNSPRRKSPLLLSPERRSPFKMSNERHRSPLRFSPDKRRSPRFNCVRRSPFGFSPERRRSPIRRVSWERRTSTDRRWSAERHRRRTNIHERRRSRSRDRQRSRSMERFRRKASRSPIGRRYSPRRRSRTRSRSLERRRKRSPFINEFNRQLRNEAIMTSHMNTGYTHTAPMEGIPPMMNNVYQPEGEPRPPLPMPPYIHQSELAPPMQPPNVPPGGPPFMNFENSSQQMNFDPVPMHPLPQTEYVSGPVMYNQPNTGAIQPPHRPPLLPAPVSPPQHEPSASTVEHVQPYNSSHGIPPARQSPIQNFEFSNKYKDSESYRERRFTDSYNGYHASQEERLKTPEPPVISDTKQFEKTSLSSLLEASVSAKDSASLPVLYPGFKPEILRHCEYALRELPMEDPRLKMKGRFFYDPTKENVKNEQNVYSSNSILLQKSKSKIYWDEEEGGQHLISSLKQNVQMHQKICQTDELETSTKFVQASVTMVDFEVQVYPQDLQHAAKEEKRPIMDRLDWNVRETFDYTPKFREADDLRWSLSNSSQKRTWSRNMSPSRRLDDREHRIDSSLDHSSRNIKLDSPIRSRDSFSGHKGSVRDHYVRERYSPNYRHSLEERDDFHENRSDHSRGESPMMLENSAEELELEHTFQRGTDWHGRGKMSRGRSSPLIKPHVYRGKHSGGRSYRGRGGFRGKF